MDEGDVGIRKGKGNSLNAAGAEVAQWTPRKAKTTPPCRAMKPHVEDGAPGSEVEWGWQECGVRMRCRSFDYGSHEARAFAQDDRL